MITAHSVRVQRYSYKKGKTPVLSHQDATKMLESIDTSHVAGLRDRALMIYSFARIGTVLSMRVWEALVDPLT